MFTYHPAAMGLGFGLLMPLGVCQALKMRAMGPGAERVKAIWVHAATQALATAFALGGFYAIYSNKALHGKAHFTTTHGQLGLIAMTLTVISPIMGGAAFKRLGILARLPEPMQAAVKWAHRKTGIVAWGAGVLATMTALPHPAVFKEGGITAAWQCAVVVAAAGLAYLYVGATSATGAGANVTAANKAGRS